MMVMQVMTANDAALLLFHVVKSCQELDTEEGHSGGVIGLLSIACQLNCGTTCVPKGNLCKFHTSMDCMEG
jgi:hypothetical protein